MNLMALLCYVFTCLSGCCLFFAGNIALVAYFQREPDIRCSSFNADTSVERCTVGPSTHNNSALIVEVQTMHPYTDLT